MRSSIAFVVACLGAACTAGTPETSDPGISTYRRVSAEPIGQDDPIDPRDDQGEQPSVVCPNVDLALSAAGAGLGVFVRNESRVFATYCGTEAGYTNELALSSEAAADRRWSRDGRRPHGRSRRVRRG
jgi:hypothetical protein